MLLQESFFRDLYCESSDEDEDSGVEEPRPLARRRSVVSFNLSPSLGDAQSTDGEGDSENEEHIYLPTHVRSIEETFDAWQESFKLPGSRASMFSSGAGSPYLQAPRIMEEDENLDTQSSSSVYSAQESDITESNAMRPASCLSFVSDNSNYGKALSAEVRSRVSSASSVSLALETASQTGSVHEESIAGDEEKGGKAFGPEEMTRSLSSVVSFITENGQITQSSPPPENFDEEPVQNDLLSKEDSDENSSNSTKKESIVETEVVAKNSNKEVTEDISIILTESEHDASTTGVQIEMDKKESALVRGAIVISKDTTEHSSTIGIETVQDVSTSGVGLSDELLSPTGEDRDNDNDEVTTEASDDGKIPSIVETVCTDDEEVHDRGINMAESSVDPNSEANSTNQENSESVPDEAVIEEFSEATEDLSNVEERIPLLQVENSTVDGETERHEDDGLKKSPKDEEKPSNFGEADCLHCQSIPKRKDAIPSRSMGDSWKGEVAAQVIDSSFENVQATLPDRFSEEKSTENESVFDEQTSTDLDLNSEIGAQGKTSAIPKDETEQDNFNEPQVSQKEAEPQGSQEDSEPRGTEEETQPKQSQKESEPQDSQEESGDKDQEEDEDDEGGYTTEASATTLQGIRGVFGRRPTRCSTAATSVGFDIEDESAFSEDGFDLEVKPYDLATKEGLDAFKEFLLETSGEKLLQFWLEVESGRHLDHDDERNRSVQL